MQVAHGSTADVATRILCFSEYCKTWYHLLVAKLLYCNPAIKSFDLQYHTQVNLASGVY